MDDIGRTTLERDVRMELIVSAADRPLLDGGGLRDSIDVLPRIPLMVGTVWVYGIDLTRT